MTSNFRIDIDGIPTTRVARIEPITIRMPLAGSPAAAAGIHPEKGPAGTLELPMLHLSVSRADAAAWRAWFEQFVVGGNNGQANEKNGSITLLAPDMKEALLVFNLYNIGIARLSEGPREANSEQIARLQAELYFERIELAGAGSIAKSSAPGTSPPASNSTTTSTVTAASAPASPTASNTAAIPKTPITRTPLAAAAETESYVIRPNPRIANGAGRLVVRFPEEIRKRDNQRTQFPKAKDEKNSEINWGSVAREMPAGDYMVTLNGKLLEGIKVQPASDTLIRLGVLRLELAENQTWELIEEDLDSAPAIFYAGGPADVALPVGTYYVRTKAEISPVKIEDGKITTFGAAGSSSTRPKQ